MSATDAINPTRTDARLIILLPVFNDWEAVGMLLPRIDRALQKHELTARVLLVDDASTSGLPERLCPGRLAAITRIEILSLRRNLGHQRSLAIGLSYIESHMDCRAVVVMDADGEDAPEDIPRLYQRLEEAGGRKIIFAERTRRAENWTFRFFYQVYRFVHLLLTGVRVRAGNFSIVPHHLLVRLVVASELWSHYSAAVCKIRLPFAMLPTRRAKRLAGSSQMNFISLMIHGLRAMAVFGDRVGARILTATIALLGLTLFSLGVAAAVCLGTNLAIPAWAVYTAGLLLAVLTQVLMTALAFVFVILHGGGSASILPLRDHSYFLGEYRLIHAADEQVQEQEVS